MPFTQNKLKALYMAQAQHQAALESAPPSFLSINALSSEKMHELLALALAMKQFPAAHAHALKGKHIALLFEKTSTRTRCSFETGVYEMGGFVTTIDWKTSNFTLADLQDEIQCLSRYYDLIMARVFKHETLETMAAHSLSPIINGLCNLHHPCQAMADYMTMMNYFGHDLTGLKVAYIGDGNNVCRSLVEGAGKLGVHITMATPKGYRLDKQTMNQAKSFASYTQTPQEAVQYADIIYTDTWVSMGDEAQAAKRLKDFAGYQVSEDLLAQAPLHALVMHCLPAHPGQEISAGVLRGPRSIVMDQAENRKHAQKAIMAWLCGKD